MKNGTLFAVDIPRLATGLILAGGAGTRVEGKDKGLLVLEGKPMIVHVAERLGPQVGKLVISCNRNLENYGDLCEHTVADTREDYQGPLAGIEAAAPLVETRYLVIAACDTPSLPADLAQRLIAELEAPGGGTHNISYAHDGDRDQYLCAALRRSCLASITPYLDDGGRAVKHWYREHRAVSVDFSDCREAFSNYNRGC